jgi:hypothetical protein
MACAGGAGREGRGAGRRGVLQAEHTTIPDLSQRLHIAREPSPRGPPSCVRCVASGPPHPPCLPAHLERHGRVARAAQAQVQPQRAAGVGAHRRRILWPAGAVRDCGVCQGGEEGDQVVGGAQLRQALPQGALQLAAILGRLAALAPTPADMVLQQDMQRRRLLCQAWACAQPDNRVSAGMRSRVCCHRQCWRRCRTCTRCSSSTRPGLGTSRHRLVSCNRASPKSWCRWLSGGGSLASSGHR